MRILISASLLKIASGSEAPWAEILRAKYYPRTGFWPSTHTYQCTVLWRGIVGIKPLLKQHLCWKIGSGESIPVYCYPWFPGWEAIVSNTNVQRRMQINTLICTESNSWDFHKLESIFGFQLALEISMSIPIHCEVPDTLLFTFSKNGKFTIKKAYQMIRGDEGQPNDKKIWMGLWKAKGLAPKLKLFIWRCILNALPVREVIGARIQTVPADCTLCQRQVESVEHAIFGCEFPRAAWCGSSLSLRTDALQGTFGQIWKKVSDSLSEREVQQFVCVAWAIWKIRNEAVFERKPPTIQTCNFYYNQTLQQCSEVNFSNLAPIQREIDSPNSSDLSIPTCYVDGSWSADNKAGIGAHLCLGGGTLA